MPSKKKAIQKVKKTFNASDYDYSDIDIKIERYKKAESIASIFSSDKDDEILYYIKVLKIEKDIPINISINEMIRYIFLMSNGDMTNLVYYLLYKQHINY